MLLSRNLRALAAIHLWIVYLLLEDLLGSCAEGDNQRLVASAPYKDIEITLEKPRVQEVAEPHTLCYNVMALSLEVPVLPQFLTLRYFDDEPFLPYKKSSRTDSQEPRIKDHLRAETWARETEDLQEVEEQLKGMLAEVTAQNSQDMDLHILQATFGCELQRNGSTRGIWKLGYDGQNLLTFDQKTLMWTVYMPSTKQNLTFWKTSAPKADLVKTFLDDICPAWLQRYLASLRNGLLDTGSPEVIVTFRNYPVGRITLTCRAFGLYTRVATLTWLQHRKPVQQKTFGSETVLPSGDGTYQAWVSIRVLPGQEPQFSCNLKHGNHNINKPAATEAPVYGERREQLPTSGVGSRVRKSLWSAMTTAVMVISWTSSQKTDGASALVLLCWLLLFSTEQQEHAGGLQETR
ncbi:hereditary hemochromatosis protein homolog [Mus caroli]|uniref:Hereditary hemochromatosis protein homolog n=1 Tax=Mus caroli TaxID=10089 RepID=A0A6P5PTF2_MUSCR|nr:hereditary hemochromatosis protein homolog [Mus caroli]